MFYAKGILLANLKRLFSGVLCRIRQLPMRRKLESRLDRTRNRVHLIALNHLTDLIKPPTRLGQTPLPTPHWSAHNVAIKSEFELFIPFVIHVSLLGLS